MSYFGQTETQGDKWTQTLKNGDKWRQTSTNEERFTLFHIVKEGTSSGQTAILTNVDVIANNIDTIWQSVLSQKW